MAGELSLSSVLVFSKGGALINSSAEASANVSGYGTKTLGTATSTTLVIDLASVSVPGFLFVRNLMTPTLISPPTPAISSISFTGTAGTAEYHYKLVVLYPGGVKSAASAESVITGAPDTLDGGDAVIALTDNLPPNAASFAWYRTAVIGGTPSTTGFINNSASTPNLVDYGLDGDATTPPSSPTGTIPGKVLCLSLDGSAFPIMLKPGEFGIFRWNGPSVSVNAPAGNVDYEATIVEA